MDYSKSVQWSTIWYDYIPTTGLGVVWQEAAWIAYGSDCRKMNIGTIFTLRSFRMSFGAYRRRRR